MLRVAFSRRSTRRRGASGSEYGMGVGLVGAAALAALLAAGGSIEDLIESAGNQVAAAGDQTTGDTAVGDAAPVYVTGVPQAPVAVDEGAPISAFRIDFSDAEGDDLTFTLAGSWPDGVALTKVDADTVEISGTPTIPGTYADLTVVAGDGTTSASSPAFTIDIADTLAIGEEEPQGSVYIGAVAGRDLYMTGADHATRRTWNNGTRYGVNHWDWPQAGADDRDNGAWNTDRLVGLNNDEAPYSAALYCSDLVAHGRDDWYLPAFNELSAAYQAAEAAGALGPFSDVVHWSSTEGGDNQHDTALFIHMDGSGWHRQAKNGYYGVRCVRTDTDNLPPEVVQTDFDTVNDAARIVRVDEIFDDFDHDPMTITAAGGAAHGEVTFQAGQVTYTPDPGYVGTDSFTLNADIGPDSPQVTLAITVADMNLPGTVGDITQQGVHIGSHQGADLYLAAPDAMEWSPTDSFAWGPTEELVLAVGGEWWEDGSNDQSDGRPNMDDIAAHGGSFPAADRCASSNAHGHSDWYLPADRELHRIWTTFVDRNGDGARDRHVPFGLAADVHWNSTQIAEDGVMIGDFADGDWGYARKWVGHAVRCVRRVE